MEAKRHIGSQPYPGAHQAFSDEMPNFKLVEFAFPGLLIICHSFRFFYIKNFQFF